MCYLFQIHHGGSYGWVTKLYYIYVATSTANEKQIGGIFEFLFLSVDSHLYSCRLATVLSIQ